MPVTTRSKRKTVDMGELEVIPKKKYIKLVDITNKKDKSQIKHDKSQITSQKSDSVLYTLKPMFSDVSDVKPTSTSRLSAVSNRIQEFPTTSSQTNIEEALKIMKRVKAALKKGYSNVAERLQLDVVPDCLFDISKCHQNHNSEKLPRKAPIENSFVTKLYLTEERHFQFCHHVRRNIVASKLNPGSDVCLSIIQEIMKFKSKDAQYSTNFVLSELHNIFITILNTFPPCHIQDSYLRLFTSQIKIEGLPEKKQILSTVFDLIHDLIYINDNAKLDESIKIDFNKNFYMWDLEHSENTSFSKLSRNDRFHRVFMALDLLVRVLEYDTAMFVTKYPQKFASTINKKQKRPLLCSIIWNQYDSLMAINATVKNIISTFVAMTALKYPVDKIRIISRLLNLITNVINMYEYPEDNIQYPIYKTYTTNLVNEIQKTVESSSYYSMELYINVIENIRSPMIRMLLANQLYSKIIGQTLPISLNTPFKTMLNRDFQKFSKSTKVLEELKKDETYPRFDAKKIAKKCRVTQDDFIKLMMLYSDAVIKNFHLLDVMNEIKRTRQCSTDVEMKHQPTSSEFADFKKRLESIDLNEKVNLRSVDLNAQNFVQIRLTKDNCTFYRNEVKNVQIMIKLIKKCHQRFDSQFDEWARMMDEMQHKI
ncbi:unnamed protein product [Chironomus riparius]|uniref:Uncharacterized protein n=1 Tax=Chironomus riparius TaxID=315576 RepID=A0A9N9WLZ4_9DIPT|nr:unnamed protein product [Chironomus riparius]